MIVHTHGTTDQYHPAGAVFHRCALQVNPGDYSKTYRGQKSNGDAQSYAEAVVERAAAIGITVLAITDHNDVSGVAAFRDAAANHGITIFPGFELSSSEGIHVLCIYSPETAELQLGRFLGAFGILEPKSSSALCNEDFVGILDRVREQRGVTIAAHVTGGKGLFKVLSGQSRIRAWQNGNLLAVQIPGAVNDLPSNVQQIVLNTNPDYVRTHKAGDSLAVAVVNATDVTQLDQLADPSATCWIKMSEVTIDGLRQAFLDPDSRIRLHSDPEPDEHAELISIAWEGGFLNDTTVRFNPNLNVLIGGRGAGKSTIIESLRYVLDLEPVGEDAQKAHEGMVRRVLRGGTKISLRVRSHRPTTSEYLIERIVNNPPLIRDSNGQVSNLIPSDILPRVEVYGQHEISELAGSPEKRIRLLDRFIITDESLRRHKVDIRQGLEETRKSILDVRSEIGQVEERLAALPGLEETLNRYQDAGLEERLSEQSLLVREEQVIDSIPERIQPFRESLALLRQELPIDLTFLSPKALEGLPGGEILAAGNEVLDKLSSDLEQIAQHIDETLKRADEGIEEIRSRWDDRKSDVETSYQKILRELQQSAVDGEEFIRLRRSIENLRPLRERLIQLERIEEEHAGKRRSLLAEWEDVKAQEFRLIDSAAKKVSHNLENRVTAAVTAAGNREPLVDLLREKVGGRLSETIDKIRQMPNFSLPVLADSCRKGAQEVRKIYAIPAAQSVILADATPEVLMQIEELELPPTTAIQLNTAPVGSPPYWQALDELSAGQKATAVLLLTLLESDAPLIVDQPEDDLDNRFISEWVVRQMKKEKRRRQFLFSTHNANIPVLGDAELILGLTASGSSEMEEGRGRIAPEHVGSIDSQSVRELVGEILEGGKEAFETRRLKYGF